MEIKPIVHEYKTQLTWTGEKKGTLGCEGKPDIKGACPPEFGGHEELWTPEDMFVGSMELCAMATFLWLAEKKRLDIISYTSETLGKASMSDGKMRFTTIEVRPKVVVPRDDDIQTARDLFDSIDRWCLITNSISTKIDILPEIRAEEG